MLPTDIHFVRPDWFWALPPLALLSWRLWARQRREPWQQLCDPALLPELLTGRSGRRNRLPVILFTLGWLLAVIALAGPAWGKLPPVVSSGPARILVLDLSRSMTATDLPPSRLERARSQVLDLLGRIEHGQVGLVAYAGEAFTVCPLTEDSNTIAALLPVLDSKLMPLPGTRTDLALARAKLLFEQAGVRHGEVILITDSADPLGPALSRAEQLRRAGYRLSVLAVGTTAGAPMPLPDGGFLRNHNGSVVIPRLADTALRRLTDAGGGRLVIAGEGDEIDKLLSTPLPASSPSVGIARAFGLQADQWLDQGPWLLLLLLPLAALGFRRGWLGIALLATLLPLLPTGPAMAADARLDRVHLSADETLHLTIGVPGRYRGEPDFSALQRDFEILDVSRASRINRVNGAIEARTEWLLTLAPLHSGNLPIPAIEVGGELTPALNLQVIPSMLSRSSGQAADVLMELSVEPQQVYVQAQTLLTLRILHALPLLDARIDQPQVGDAELRQLGQDRAYRVQRAGREYRVVERRWALFPQHPGTLQIPAMTLAVQLGNRSRPATLPGSSATAENAVNGPGNATGSQSGRKLRLRSNPLTLEVKTQPSDIPAKHWLPAQTIEILAATAAAGRSSVHPFPFTPALPQLDPLNAFLGIGWMLTLLLWLRERRRGAGPRQAKSPRLRRVRAMLRRGCRDHDPDQSRQALLAWARLAWPDKPPQSLAMLAQRLPAGAGREAVLDLDRALYQDPEHWRSSDFRNALEQLVHRLPDQPRGQPALPGLPTLYPTP